MAVWRCRAASSSRRSWATERSYRATIRCSATPPTTDTSSRASPMPRTTFAHRGADGRPGDSGAAASCSMVDVAPPGPCGGHLTPAYGPIYEERPDLPEQPAPATIDSVALWLAL